ncbi:MAG: hypothetical protein MAG551_02239 [Candidatus Scalindua arabica]|uniref:Uncharacterized protein n=1 Tax=Candidatus Scalindua arabica TaxID=1127984 RepID=A0A942A6M7_9BACT|nr:hypothetical protein [Candidatus Scalindua arabica]
MAHVHFAFHKYYNNFSKLLYHCHERRGVERTNSSEDVDVSVSMSNKQFLG